MERKQSGFGVASFVLSIIVAFLVFMTVGAAGIVGATSTGGLQPKSVAVMVLALCLMGAFLLDFLALALGFAGLCQSDRKKSFAALGTGFSCVLFLGTLAIILLNLDLFQP